MQAKLSGTGEAFVVGGVGELDTTMEFFGFEQPAASASKAKKKMKRRWKWRMA
jgi:hypothetical protein